MRRLLFLLIYTTHSIVYGQGWTQTDTLPEANRYDDVYFNTDDHGWVVNSRGEIFKTVDGGMSWREVFTSDLYMRSIEFINDSIGFAGSLDGVVLRTHDSGETWYAIEGNIPGPFGGICGFAHVDDYVYGVGVFDGPARFLTSKDAGITWTNKDLSLLADGVVDVHFIDTLTGFIGATKDGDGAIILRTTDGGNTWERVFASPGPVSLVWKLFFVNSQVAYGSIEAVDGASRFAKTIDGGETWESINGPAGLYFFQGIGFDTPLHGWLSSSSDSIFETHDGGMTWEQTENLRNLNRFFQVPGGRLYASGSQVYFRDGVSGSSAFIEPSYFHSLFVFPVPFSHSSTIVVTIDTKTHVRIGITSLDGKKNVAIYKGHLNQGSHVFNITPDILAGMPHELLIVYMTTNEGFLAKQVFFQ